MLPNGLAPHPPSSSGETVPGMAQQDRHYRHSRVISSHHRAVKAFPVPLSLHAVPWANSAVATFLHTEPPANEQQGLSSWT